MLLSYCFSNFLSFANETRFSMRPGRMPVHLQDNAIQPVKGIRANKSAVIAGENAGGKTNFIFSFDYIKQIISSKKRIRISPNSINWGEKKNENSLQKFAIEVFIDPNYIFKYTLVLNMLSVHSEKLECKKSYQKTFSKLFETKVEVLKRSKIKDDEYQINFKCSVEIDNNVLSNDVQSVVEKITVNNIYKNGVFLPFFANFYPPAQEFLDWIVNRLIIARSPFSGTNYFNDQLEDDSILKVLKSEEYLEIFRMVDETIVKIIVDEKRPFEETIILRKNDKMQEFECKLKNDSRGVKFFFGWAIQIWQVIYQNKIVLADEVDSTINPVLSSKIISLINGFEHHGQFIFTTHNILHLNTVSFAKEQMWFIHKDGITTNSELYSLADFENFSYNTNREVYKLYLKGLLGGVGNA